MSLTIAIDLAGRRVVAVGGGPVSAREARRFGARRGEWPAELVRQHKRPM